MSLTIEENNRFFKLFFSLLSYVNDKFQVLNLNVKPDDIKTLSPDEIGKIRDLFYKNTMVLDYFVLENPSGFSPQELDIVESWHKYVKKTFYVMTHLKNYSIFLDIMNPPKSYGVHAFGASFDELIGSNFPIMVEAILLPFGDKIICDSVIDSYTHRPAADVKVILKNAYHDAKSKYGIILNLSEQPVEKKQSQKELLKYYTQDLTSRNMFQHRIDEMIKNDPEMESIFYKEINKKYAREIRKRARKNGETGHWFVILNGKVISSGETREFVQKFIDESLPENLRSRVFIFQI